MATPDPVLTTQLDRVSELSSKIRSTKAEIDDLYDVRVRLMADLLASGKVSAAELARRCGMTRSAVVQQVGKLTA